MYKKTVLCHHCWESGHNKRTCPKLAAKVAANPDSFLARRYTENKERGKERKCSYCYEMGHNRATCKKLSLVQLTAIDQNAAFRAKTLDCFKQYGIGLGTLFHLKHVNWLGEEDDGESLILMVEEIKWDEIVYQNANQSIIVNLFSERNYYHSFTVNTYFFDLLKKGSLTVLNRASDEYIGVGIPNKWEKGISNLQRAFPSMRD